MVDYKTVVEAEKGQEKLDGAQVGDSNIRVSFCPPGKTAEEKFSKFDTPVSCCRDQIIFNTSILK